MLASQPPTTLLHTGGGISVRVNGTAIENSVNLQTNSAEPLNNRVDKVLFNSGDSNIRVQNKTSNWTNATITWGGEAQHTYSGNCNSESPNSDTAKTCIVTSSQSVPTTPSAVDSNSTAQLVHVIRVQSSTPNSNGMEEFHSPRLGNDSLNGPLSNKSVSSATIRITSPSDNACQTPNHRGNNINFCNDKISVVVRTPIGHLVKGEDERSSSGASSAPGSDCERSDSDREGDDGTDSGFSSSRRHCASIMVTTKNSNNIANTLATRHSENHSSLNGTTKVPVISNDNDHFKLTIGSYAEKNSNSPNSDSSNDDGAWDMHFHVRELETLHEDKIRDSEDVQTKITTAHALLSGQGDTFTLRNRVRSSIVSLLVQSTTNRNYDQEEIGRVVFYTTSMGVVRGTYERCRKVRKILETLMVKFEERDVFMNRGFQQEIRERLGSTRVIVPQVFVEGRHLGGAEVLEQLNEIGHLRDLLRPYKRQSVGGTCQQCGGYKYLLCPICGGSKKSTTHRHHFSEDLVALRCVACDESGLIRCPQCITGEG